MGNINDWEFLGASGSFVGSSVVSADIGEEVASNVVLDSVSVNTVGNEPWNVLVGWHEGCSLKGNFVL